MDYEMGRLFSYVYGAEEFVYLLGKRLFNYGGYISSGIYNEYSGGTSKPRPPIIGNSDVADDYEWAQERGLRKNQAQELPYHGSAPINPSFIPRDGEQQTTEPQPAREAAPNSPKREPVLQREQGRASKKPKPSGTRDSSSSASKENDEHEHYLQETIQGMKVDYEDDDSVFDFREIAGLGSVKVALEEFACFFLNFPHLTHNLRQRSTTGILLFGPQGTGKTLLVKSFAKKYNLALYDIRASAIMSKFVGESEKFVRALFKEVRANAPSVLMLDECDGLLCNPTADATQSHNYRLLQNELKNQWSDLIYSRDEVIVVGATNKPHDIDMDGFGRRLSLKLHVVLPNHEACQTILEGALSRLRHRVDDAEFAVLGRVVYDRGLSGYDVDCLVEALLRKAIREITMASYFARIPWEDSEICVPCSRDDPEAIKGSWSQVAAHAQEVSYRPFEVDHIKAAIQRARPTVDEAMMQRHIEFASQYGTDE